MFINAALLSPSGRQFMVDWCARQGISAHDTFRIVYHPQTSVCTVFQYERNANGNHFIDCQSGEIAQRNPFNVTVNEPIIWQPEYEMI